MASSSASSMAASKLFNLTKPALNSLIRRHLIRPSAQLIQSPHEQIADSLNNSPIYARVLDLNNNASNSPMNLRIPFINSRIEMARTYVPNNAEEEFDDDDEDDDDDDDVDDDDIQDFSGSDLEDEVDEEHDSRPRGRSYKK